MSLLLALLQAAPQPPDPPGDQVVLASGGGGHSVRHRRSRAVPGWALPMLNMPIELTPEQRATAKAMRTRRQLRQLRALKVI